MTGQTGRPPDARLAVVSDTHGLLPAAVLDACAGADLIVHAGDVGSVDVLEALAAWRRCSRCAATATAPARSPNCPWRRPASWAACASSWRTSAATCGPPTRTRPTEGIRLLLYGHSHRAEIRYRGAAPPGGIPVLWVNPGTVSAPLPWDPRPSMAWVEIRGGEPEARLVFLG